MVYIYALVCFAIPAFVVILEEIKRDEKAAKRANHKRELNPIHRHRHRPHLSRLAKRIRLTGLPRNKAGVRDGAILRLAGRQAFVVIGDGALLAVFCRKTESSVS
jgi:hypothetical protein